MKASGECLICGGKFRTSRVKILLECRNCGFITADQTLSFEQQKELYNEQYFHGAEYSDYHLEAPALRLNFARRIETLKKILPHWPNVNILDIGCAYGYFLDMVRGVSKTAIGIDVSEAGVTWARENLGVECYVEDIQVFKPPYPTDLVTLWDTIEHVPDPDLMISRIAEYLSEGGFIAITTGDIESLSARVSGSKWRMIHPPTHLHYFSVRTISLILEKHGFEIVHVSHPGVTRTFDMIIAGLSTFVFKNIKFLTLLRRAPFLNRTVTLNLYDIMYVIAKKK